MWLPFSCSLVAAEQSFCTKVHAPKILGVHVGPFGPSFWLILIAASG